MCVPPRPSGCTYPLASPGDLSGWRSSHRVLADASGCLPPRPGGRGSRRAAPSPIGGRAGLGDRNEHEGAFLGAEKVADALGVGLDGQGQIAVAVLGDRDNVITSAVMPERVAYLERTISG